MRSLRIWVLLANLLIDQDCIWPVMDTWMHADIHHWAAATSCAQSYIASLSLLIRIAGRNAADTCRARRFRSLERKVIPLLMQRRI